MQSKFFYILGLAAITAFSSCSKDEAVAPSNEEEVITTVTLSLKDSANSAAPALVFTYKDLDGAGGNAPTIDNLSLAPNKTYYVTNTVADDSKTPSVDITAEIKAEQNDHQFFYFVTGLGLRSKYAATDFDTNVPAKPLGLVPIFKTGASGSGILRVLLKHQPDTKKTISNAVGDETIGDTDIDITFNFSII